MHAMNFEFFEELKYTQMPVDWFIRDPKFYHRYQDHNWRKTRETPLLGLGPSAYSCVEAVQYYNVNDLMRWTNMVRSGSLPIWRGEVLNTDDQIRRSLMLGLKFGVDVEFFKRRFGVNVVEYFSPEWNELRDLGLIESAAEGPALTYAGRLFADEVGRGFYSAGMRQRMMKVQNPLISTTWPQFNP